EGECFGLTQNGLLSDEGSRDLDLGLPSKTKDFNETSLVSQVMSNLSTSVRPPHATRISGPIQIPGVRSFLIKSERKVVEHCAWLLKANELASEDRRRLTRLVELVETELQRLET
ncbi:MAG: hypothetical protein V4477_08380, partial [Pseudomonadota bacterium]